MQLCCFMMDQIKLLKYNYEERVFYNYHHHHTSNNTTVSPLTHQLSLDTAN